MSRHVLYIPRIISPGMAKKKPARSGWIGGEAKQKSKRTMMQCYLEACAGVVAEKSEEVSVTSVTPPAWTMADIWNVRLSAREILNPMSPRIEQQERGVESTGEIPYGSDVTHLASAVRYVDFPILDGRPICLRQPIKVKLDTGSGGSRTAIVGIRVHGHGQGANIAVHPRPG